MRKVKKSTGEAETSDDFGRFGLDVDQTDRYERNVVRRRTQKKEKKKRSGLIWPNGMDEAAFGIVGRRFRLTKSDSAGVGTHFERLARAGKTITGCTLDRGGRLALEVSESK